MAWRARGARRRGESRFRSPFSRLTRVRPTRSFRSSVVTKLEPQTPLETFFVMAKQATVRGYYTSEIGIHKELRYKGNHLREFVGLPDRGRQGLPALRSEEMRTRVRSPGRHGRPYSERRNMQTDPTLNVDLTRALEESKRLAASIKPGSARWDVIVVGSGAAGGMAAFQLATAGIKVLLLEAGRMIDWQKEYRTMEWPYASMRRGRLPLGERAIDVAEYSFLDRPYGNNPAFESYKKLASYAATRSRATGSWTRSSTRRRARRTLGARARPRRQDELLGTRRAALRAAAVQGGQPRRLRRGLADLVRRREAVLRQGRRPARLLRARTKGSTRCRTACSSGRRS